MAISKKVREEAALIAAIWASTPKGWQDARWSDAAIDLYTAAFAAVLKAEGVSGWAGYQSPYDAKSHERAAETERLILSGWTPEPRFRW